MKNPWSFSQILLLCSITIVIAAVIVTLIITNTTLRSVEQNLPDTLIKELISLDHVLELLSEVVTASEVTTADPSPENLRVLTQNVNAAFEGINSLRRSYVFDNLIQASSFHAVVAPAIADLRIWLAEGVSGYGPGSSTTNRIIESRIKPAYEKAKTLSQQSRLIAQGRLDEQRQRLNRLLSSINLLFMLTLMITLVMVLLFIHQHRLNTREIKSRERLHYFKTAVEYSSDAIGMSDPKGSHWYQNKAFDELFGDIGKDPPASLYKNESTGRQIFATIMAGGQWSGEVEMHGKDGTVLSVLLRAYSIKDANGGVIGLVGTHTDITRQKKAEIALQKNEQLMRAILDANPDPMVMYDRAGIPQFMNPAFTEVFGWTLEELRGGRIPFVPEDQKAHTFEKIKEIYVHGKPLRINTQRYTKDNRTLDIFLSAAVTKDDNGIPTGMVVNLSDITQRKTLEAQYEQAQKMESLGTLAGGIAHDFNNLLSGIYGYLDLAQKKTTDPNISRYLTRALNSSERAKNLTRQLLTFSKGGEPVKKIEPLTSFLQETTQFALSGSNVSSGFNIAPDLWMCDYDKNQMGQVIENIVINAVHAMPSGGNINVTAMNVTIPENTLSSLQPGRYVKISIADTGTGIPERYLPRIFDPFFTTKQKGSGLGLATSYSIVKRHGGIIEVESEPGRGSCFHAFIPAAAGPVTIERAAPEERYKSSGMILIMDDEEMITEMLTAMLESMGFTTSITRDGRQAAKVFKTLTDQNLPVRAIILDLTVPGAMGGKETVREIRKINATVPVFVASGYSEDAAIANPEDFGFTAALEKPFSILDLSRMLEKHLGV
jgi:PAS domain S-box-containing protein